MPTQIFVNLPVADLEKSKAFYTSLGYGINPTFTNENAACVMVSDIIHVMLLVRPFFQGFTKKAVADAHKELQTLVALSAPDRAAVDALLDKALAAGGKEPGEPQDYGFMYQRSFEDLDGHTWEIAYMNEAEFPGA
ncbi:VOC family protein [[Pseudomonas] boreopolis]|uniref:Extradiol dioxygenase n=1 Tax=Xanthomonas boreopolis TaxID=86183 RepID=A0A919F7K3_9XANT|nr:extradiol dioxygenase [[Pseudomonas] boreopolis]